VDQLEEAGGVRAFGVHVERLGVVVGLVEDATEEVAHPSLQRLLPDEAPAYVLGRRRDVLAWNRGACELLVDFDVLPPAPGIALA